MLEHEHQTKSKYLSTQYRSRIYNLNPPNMIRSICFLYVAKITDKLQRNTWEYLNDKIIIDSKNTDEHVVVFMVAIK